MLEEAEVTCPCCWETIVLDLDLSAGSQTYTEDCPVCCRPMTVRLRVELDDDPDDPDAEETPPRFEVDVESESD